MKRLIALLLAACMMLSGCSSWMDGSYVSISPHMAQENDQDQDMDWISDAEQLYEAIRNMVAYGKSSEIFYTRDYGQRTVSSDMAQVEFKIMNADPVGAYAVEDIQYELGVNGSQSTIVVNIEYNHTRAEILRIQKVRNAEEAKRAIKSVLNQLNTDLVLYVENYQQTDFAQIVEDYAQEKPEMVIEIPQVSVAVYPYEGDERVVELKFSYQLNRDNLRTMQNQVKRVFDSAALYVSSDETTHEKFAHLYSFLMERFDYQIDTSITPAYSLLRYGVGDSKAFAVVFAAMCRQIGLECLTVSGTRNGEPWFWNIVKEDDAYCHVDLLRCVEVGEYRERSDVEMEGYVWDYSGYPSCDREIPPEMTDPAEPTDDMSESDTESAETEIPADTAEPNGETEAHLKTAGVTGETELLADTTVTDSIEE